MDRLTDDEFTGLFAAPTDSADPAPVEEAAPGSESAPIDASASSDALPDAGLDAAPVPAPAAEPVGPNWDDESNPYLAQARQFQQAQAAMQRWQQQQQLQATQQAITDLAEGDTDRQAQIHTLIDRIASPLQQHARQHEQRAVTSEKALTAAWIAFQATADENQLQKVKDVMGQLMTVNDPAQMERLAFVERDAAQKYTQQLSQKDQEIAELRKQLGLRAVAADRAARGADVVDAGRGLGAGGPVASAQANNDFDSWFEQQFAARTA